jgi:ERF superfamily
MFGPKISAAFVQAQKAFGPALKSSTNPHFRSRYADLAACVEAVIDALNQHGIALMQMTSECEDGVIVETVLLHESGEALPCGKLHVVASKQDPQGYGSALTYARRYSLMAACGIAPEDDDGNAATRPAKASISASTMAAHIADIADSANSEELNKAYALAYAACEGDASWQAKVIAAKKARIEKAKQEKVQSNGQ